MYQKSHNEHKTVETIFLVGGRGSGKSTKAKKLMQKHKRIIVLDPTREYARELGYTSCKNLNEIIEIMKTDYPKGFTISYTPNSQNPLDRTEDLDDLARLALFVQKPFFEGKSKEKLLIVVEEMNRAYPNSQAVLQKMPNFGALITEGRHYGIHLYGIDQSEVKVHTTFRDNVSEIYLFNQSVRHLSALTRLLDSKDLALKAVNQKPHHYIHICDAGITEGRTEL